MAPAAAEAASALAPVVLTNGARTVVETADGAVMVALYQISATAVQTFPPT